MQAHRVNQAQVELDVDDVELATALIERVSQLHPRALAATLDRVCSELSGPGRIDRIDALELELGDIAADEFEPVFIERLEAALRSALARSLRERAGVVEREAALELLEAFAWTTTLPWWAGGRAGDPVGDALSLLLREAPRALVELLRELAEEPPALARVARHFARQDLIRLADSEWAAGLPGRLREHARLVRTQVEDASEDPSRGAEATLDDRSIAEPRAEHEVEPHASSDERGRPPERGVSRLAQLDDRGSGPVIEEGLEQPRPAYGQPTDAPAAADSAADSEPEGERGVGREPRPDESRAAVDPDMRVVGSEGQADVLGSLGASPEIRESDDSRARIDRTRIDRPGSFLDRDAGRTRERAAAARSARVDAIARLDELHVDDGGLVLLWPFLARLFTRLELVDERREFVDEPARMQAIELLERLAFDEPDPPEYLLPLAKLLCGLAPTDDFVPGDPLTPEQLAEGERLLTAVIDHAAILQDMSIPRFRAGFLQRPAVLRTLDGSWLLRVERRTHDVVLERFPWAWDWVKLPWMAHALRVDW